MAEASSIVRLAKNKKSHKVSKEKSPLELFCQMYIEDGKEDIPLVEIFAAYNGSLSLRAFASGLSGIIHEYAPRSTGKKTNKGKVFTNLTLKKDPIVSVSSSETQQDQSAKEQDPIVSVSSSETLREKAFLDWQSQVETSQPDQSPIGSIALDPIEIDFLEAEATCSAQRNRDYLDQQAFEAEQEAKKNKGRGEEAPKADPSEKEQDPIGVTKFNLGRIQKVDDN